MPNSDPLIPYEAVLCPHATLDEESVQSILSLASRHDKPFIDIDDQELHIHVGWNAKPKSWTSWTVLVACDKCCFAEDRPLDNSGNPIPLRDWLRAVDAVRQWYGERSYRLGEDVA